MNRGDRFRLLFDDSGECLDGCVSLEGSLPSNHFIEDSAKGKLVRAEIN